MIPQIFIAGAIGYLLGALPFGYLVARARGVNIFEVGSRSPGATNVRRVLGPGPGNLVFVLDMLKGVVATSLPIAYAGWLNSNRTGGMALFDPVPLCVAGVVGALLGHSFSCFTKFRGGKGVATGAGGFFVLMPVATGIGGLIWLLTFFTSRYVSLASMAAAVSLPLSAWLLHYSPPFVGMACLIAVFVIYRHRENCRRLMNGTENRFGKKKEDDSQI